MQRALCIRYKAKGENIIMRALHNPTKKKYKIQVRYTTVCRDQKYIYRVLYTEMIGNFAPLFCRYDNQVYLVKSDDNDPSDIFRRTENDKLYIEVPERKNWADIGI